MKYSRTDTGIKKQVSEDESDAHLHVLPRSIYGSVGHHPNITRPHQHDHRWAQLSYAIQGHLQVWTPQARFVALPQRAVWIPAQVRHQVHQSPQAIIRSLYLDSDALGLNWPHCRILTISPLLHELIRQFSTLPSTYDENGPDGRLVQVLVDQLVIAPEAGLILPWPTDARLDAICRELYAAPAEASSLRALSARLCVSEKTLTRLFQQQTGIGFRLWRQRARLMHALPLLEQGDRITDIALSCGYDSLSSFIAAFREHTGSTPGSFMANTNSTAHSHED